MSKDLPFALPLDRDSDDLIRTIAHNIWMDEGCPEGKTEELWARANLIVAAFSSLVEGDEALVAQDASAASAVEPQWLVRTQKGAEPTVATPVPRQSKARRSAA
jgi:Protein of unknown function (DUF2934)